MGRATRWFKSLLGIKKYPEIEKTPQKNENVGKQNVGKSPIERRWSFSKVEKKINNNSSNNNNKWYENYGNEDEKEQSKQAIAVAAATAAAADAAVAAAQAAVAVVRLTSKGGGRGGMFSGGGREKWGAIKIQTLFRGYLARKALRALRALVKLQAHVRGYLVRKRATATLRSMQALIRAQATARSQRVTRSFNKNHKVQPEFRPRKSMDKFDEFHSKRLSTSYETHNAYEGSPKIVEIDTYKPRSRSRRITPSVNDLSSEDYQYPTMSSPLPYPPIHSRVPILDYQNMHHQDFEWSFYGDEGRASTAQSTPRMANSIRFNGPSTPTKSVCGDSFFRPYSNFPSYMSETQSFRAKSRSHSAPKQRPEARPKKRLSLDQIMAARNSISGVRMQRCCSQVQDTLNYYQE